VRRLITIVLVAGATAVGTLSWLHDEDLTTVVQPVIAQWNAELLAKKAGLWTDATTSVDGYAADEEDVSAP
jgi:hypothetical protein